MSVASANVGGIVGTTHHSLTRIRRTAALAGGPERKFLRSRQLYPSAFFNVARRGERANWTLVGPCAKPSWPATGVPGAQPRTEQMPAIMPPSVRSRGALSTGPVLPQTTP